MVEVADEHGVMGTRPALEPGQKVVVRSGPFAISSARWSGSTARAGRVDLMTSVRAVRMDIQDIDAL